LNIKCVVIAKNYLKGQFLCYDSNSMKKALTGKQSGQRKKANRQTLTRYEISFNP